MRTGTAVRILIVAALTLLAGALLFAQQKAAKSPSAPARPQPMFTPYDSNKWTVMMPDLGKDSPLISILRVDPKTNATQLLIRSTSALHVPFHWHSANETHTMIRGTAVFECDGKQAKLGPGGYNYIPAKMQHQAWLSADSMVFITVDSAWDVNWVAGPPQKSDVGKAAPSSK